MSRSPGDGGGFSDGGPAEAEGFGASGFVLCAEEEGGRGEGGGAGPGGESNVGEGPGEDGVDAYFEGFGKGDGGGLSIDGHGNPGCVEEAEEAGFAGEVVGVAADEGFGFGAESGGANGVFVAGVDEPLAGDGGVILEEGGFGEFVSAPGAGGGSLHAGAVFEGLDGGGEGAEGAVGVEESGGVWVMLPGDDVEGGIEPAGGFGLEGTVEVKLKDGGGKWCGEGFGKGGKPDGRFSAADSTGIAGGECEKGFGGDVGGENGWRGYADEVEEGRAEGGVEEERVGVGGGGDEGSGTGGEKGFEAIALKELAGLAVAVLDEVEEKHAVGGGEGVVGEGEEFEVDVVGGNGVGG